MARSRGEKGQAVPILVIALSILLVGGMGLAIDAGNLYQQTQRAQSAADAAATAAMTSVFKAANLSGAAAFSTSATFTCDPGTDARLPCQYARMNGFGLTASDTVTVSFPTCTGSPDPCGYQSALSTVISPNQVQVTISRNTGNSIIKMLGGPATSLVNATGIAAIVEVESPTPIIVTHPTLSQSLNLNGSTTLQICGGPARSIQVNSSSPTAFNPANGTIDLSKAGPAGNASCTQNAGADFAVLGGDYTNPGEVLLGTGSYHAHTGPIPDPFEKMVEQGYFGYTTDSNPPPLPPPAATPTYVAYGTSGCVNPAASSAGCYLYHHGRYDDSTYRRGLKPNECSGGNGTSCLAAPGGGGGGGGGGSTTYVLFEPGLYYVRHAPTGSAPAGADFTQTSGGGANYSVMCSTCASDTYTGDGMIIYDQGPEGNPANSGGFNVGTGANVVFKGPTLTQLNSRGETVPAPPYYNVVFWENRGAIAHTGSSRNVIGTGTGCFTMDKASIYITNTREIMGDPTHYQEVRYAGTPCSGTENQGLIVVSTLQLAGGSTITMNLDPAGFLYLDQVALVGGGAHP